MTDFGDESYWRRLHKGRVGRRRVLAGGATLLTGGVALGLIGCGSSNNNQGGATTAPGRAASATQVATAAASPPAAATTAAAAPASPVAAAAAVATPQPAGDLKTGGTLQGVTVGPHPLNPVTNTTYRAQWAAGYHYGRLFRFNTGPDPQTNLSRTPIPDHVLGWETTPDGLTYAMKLRPGITFHPPLNRPFTSADALASYQYFTTNSKNTNAGVYNPIVDSLTAPDDNTIVWKLKLPYAPFLNKLGNTQYLWLFSADAVNGKIDPETQVVGTGPWLYDNQTPTAVSWKKNPNYWNKGLPYADQAILNIIPDASTQNAQFQAGAIDVYAPPAADIETMKKAVPKANVAEYTPDGFNFLFFYNVMAADSPFKDPRVRQAASLAIDRQGLIDAIYNGRAVWENIVNAGLGKWFLDPQGKDIGESGKWFKHDPQQAKQLLQAAGHTDTQFKFFYPNNAYGDTFNATADAIRGMLADAGFKLQVITVDYLKDWINNGQGYFNKGLPQNGIGSALQTPFTDPDDFLTGMLTPGGNRNGDLVDDPDLTALVKKQQVELDENKRLQEVYDVQRAQAEKMYYVPMIYTKVYLMSQPWVQNVYVADDYDFGTEQVAYMSVNK